MSADESSSALRWRVDAIEGTALAIRSLRQNRQRTVLTTLGVGVGVATLLAILSVIAGLDEAFAKQLASLGGSSLHISKFPWIPQGDFWLYRNRKDLGVAEVEALRTQSRYVRAVAPTANRMADVSGGASQLANVTIVGATADYLEVNAFEIDRGRFLFEAEGEGTAAVAIIGADVAQGLFGGAEAVGETIRVGAQPLRVVGVLERKGKLLEQNQDLTVLLPLKLHRQLFGRRRSIAIGVAARTPDDLDVAEDELRTILRRVRRTPPDKDDDFAINRPEQLAATYQRLTSALYGVAVGVGLLTLLVGGVGIMNIMLVSVRERTREVGIRRALGARRRTVVMQFLLEAVVVSALGGALGTLVGVGVAQLVAWISPLAAAVSVVQIIFGVLFSALIGVVFSIYPAALAARMDPIEALRHE